MSLGHGKQGVCLALLLACAVLQGCALWKATPHVGQTLLDVKAYGRYAKLVGLGIYDNSGRDQVELMEQLEQTMVTRLQKYMGKGYLIKPGDPDFPDYLEVLPTTEQGNPDNMALAQAARQDGFQALVMVSLESLVPLKEKKGMLWWRRDKYYLLTFLAADVLDPVTGARLLSLIEQVRVGIEAEDYNYFRDPGWTAPDSAQHALAKRAKALAKKIAKALDGLKWQVTVTAAENGQAFLPAGSRVGLAAGDRLVLFAVDQVVAGVKGEVFVVPGFRKGDLVVEKVYPDYCRARSGTRAQVGDVAVPVR